MVTYLKQIHCLVVTSCEKDTRCGVELHGTYYSLSPLGTVRILHPLEVNGTLWQALY